MMPASAGLKLSPRDPRPNNRRADLGRMTGGVEDDSPVVSARRGLFRVSLRVQAAGVVSLLSVPVVLALLVWGLVSVSVALAIAVGFGFTVGVQAAVARRWTLAPTPAVRAREVELFAVVDRICTAADLPLLAVVVHEKPWANSWVTGLTVKRTRLHLTRGLLDVLDEHQLAAVIAHELAHVRQKDSALMSLAGTPVAAMADGAAFYFHGYVQMTNLWKNRREVISRPTASKDERDSDAAAVGEGVFYWGAAWVVFLPIGVLFFVVGSLCRSVTAVFSRARELEADAAGALLTGNPAALASALIALSGAPRALIPLTDLRQAASLDVFHIVAIAKERPLLHTHPSLKRRLAQLAAIEAHLQHA